MLIRKHSPKGEKAQNTVHKAQIKHKEEKHKTQQRINLIDLIILINLNNDHYLKGRKKKTQGKSTKHN